MLALVGSNPVLRQRESPTLADADRWFTEYVDNYVRTADANDVLYALEASWDYDPGPGLERITAPLLAVNFADDLVNPPELGILEREIARVPKGRAVVIPFSDATRGHGSHTDRRPVETSARRVAGGVGHGAVMPPPRWGIARRLFAIDILTMAFVIALGGGAIARSAQIPDWPVVVMTCAGIAVVIPLLGWLRTHLDVAPVRVLHDWSFALCVYVIYRMVLLQAGPGWSGRVFDDWLIDADRWMFGVDPTVWLALSRIPIVTEVLQLAYAMFYLLPLAVALEIYASGREWRFRQWAFVCGCGFFASYAGYLIMPAVGPRFTLHTTRGHRPRVAGPVADAGPSGIRRCRRDGAHRRVRRRGAAAGAAGRLPERPYPGDAALDRVGLALPPAGAVAGHRRRGVAADRDACTCATTTWRMCWRALRWPSSASPWRRRCTAGSPGTSGRSTRTGRPERPPGPHLPETSPPDCVPRPQS